MRHQWAWLCASGLILAGLAGCGPALSYAPSDANATPHLQPPTTPEVASTATREPSSTSGSEPSRLGGDTPLWTVVPLFPTQIPTEKRPVSSTPLALPSESTESVKLAKQDLAQRLGVSVDSITVVAVIGQDFSTDAFYCRTTKERIARDPAPELISGQTILLSTSGHRYEYHASGQTVIFCRPLS